MRGEIINVSRLFQHFRHSFAIHLARSGLDLGRVQQLLGHSSLNTTQVYLQFNDQDLREGYNKVEFLHLYPFLKRPSISLHIKTDNLKSAPFLPFMTSFCGAIGNAAINCYERYNVLRCIYTYYPLWTMWRGKEGRQRLSG